MLIVDFRLHFLPSPYSLVQQHRLRRRFGLQFALDDRQDFARESLGALLNALGAEPMGVLIQRDLAKEIGFQDEWHFCPGGGLGVAYHEDELPPPDLELYVEGIARELTRRCRTYGISLPTLHLEPGRSLVARAGVAIYSVGAIKRRRHRTWLLADGGMTSQLVSKELYRSKAQERT